MRIFLLTILFVFSAVLYADPSCEHVLKVPRLTKAEYQQFRSMNKDKAFGIFGSVTHFTNEKQGPFIVPTLPLPWLFKPLAYAASFIPGKVGFMGQMIWETPSKAVLVMQPEMIQDVFKNTTELARPYNGLGSVIGKESFFILQDYKPDEHQQWELVHKLVMPHFQPRKIIDEYLPKMKAIAQDLVQQWKTEGKTEITVGEMSFFFAARVASDLFLNHNLTLEEARKLRPATDSILTDTKSREEGGRQLHAFLLEKTNLDHASDLVKDLLRYQQQQNLPDSWLSSQLATLYFAAVETTQSLLGTSLYYLTKHPGWAGIVSEEYASFGADEALSLNKTPQIRDFLSETLRMNAPVPATYRYTVKDVVIGDYRIPKGTMIYMSFQSMHRDRKIWGETADNFDPDRFLEDTNGELSRSLIPFGSGIRVCIGKYLALMEAAIFIGEITTQLNLSMPADQDLPLGYASGTLRVKDELKLQISPK